MTVRDGPRSDPRGDPGRFSTTRVQKFGCNHSGAHARALDPRPPAGVCNHRFWSATIRVHTHAHSTPVPPQGRPPGGVCNHRFWSHSHATPVPPQGCVTADFGRIRTRPPRPRRGGIRTGDPRSSTHVQRHVATKICFEFGGFASFRCVKCFKV